MKRTSTLNKFMAASALALAATTVALPAQAQSAQESATRLANLQKNSVVAPLAEMAANPVMAKWLPSVDSIPQAKRPAAAQQMNAEMQKYNAENVRAIQAATDRLAPEVLVPALKQRFSEDELRQIVTFMESPAAKKYFSANPELGNLFAGKVAEATSANVKANMASFDKTATEIVHKAGGKLPK